MKTAAMKKTVSILGCGWFGKALAKQLLENGYSVKGSTTTRSKLQELQVLAITPFLIDIEKDDNIDDFLQADVLAICITSKNTNAFERFLRKVEKSTVKKVIFISSTSVYATLNKEVIETDELVNSPLVAVEKLIQQLKNTHWIILRFAGLLGYNRHPSNWFQSRKIPQPKGFVNMIHRDDCIAVTTQLIESAIKNDVFNVCANHHPTREEFYTKAKVNKGFPKPEFEHNKPLQWKKINSDKLQKTLEYKYKFDDLFDV